MRRSTVGIRRRKWSRVALLATGALLVGISGCSDDVTGPVATKPTRAAAAAPLKFVQVSAGGFHTCGVTTDGRAYCWGANDKGQLGDGTTMINVGRTTPVAVIGGLRFRHVNVGYEHSCGVTVDNRLYCWVQPSMVELRMRDAGAYGAGINGPSNHGAVLWNPTNLAGDSSMASHSLKRSSSQGRMTP